MQDLDFQTHIFPMARTQTDIFFEPGALLPTSKPKITPYGQQGQTALLPMKTI